MESLATISPRSSILSGNWNGCLYLWHYPNGYFNLLTYLSTCESPFFSRPPALSPYGPVSCHHIPLYAPIRPLTITLPTPPLLATRETYVRACISAVVSKVAHKICKSSKSIPDEMGMYFQAVARGSWLRPCALQPVNSEDMLMNQSPTVASKMR